MFWHMQLYMSWYIRSFFGFTFLNILYFLKYSCTNISHRRSLYTFYWKANNGCVVLILMRSCWCHQIKAFSALLALCEGNPPVTGVFPSQRLVTRGFDIFFDLCLNKRLSKRSRRWWFETPSGSLWRHCNGARCNDTHNSVGGER